MPKKLPEYNAASLADIAFMLLIFFLVTTTMDTDLGILKMLPPPAPDEQPQDDKVKERNIFVVLINKNDQLLVEGKPMDIKNLKDEAKKFIENPNRDVNLPEFKKGVEVPFFGIMDISKQIVSLQNDRGTSYGVYIQALNELTAAYVELRNELAMRKFGKVFDDLDEDRQKAIKEIYPQKISEAEPKNYGGK